MKTYQIEKIAQDMIDKFMNLRIGGKTVYCPYHINPKTQRANLRVLAGKGNPDEIVLETDIYGKLGGLDLTIMDADEIREFMGKRHIGIDCSGFVVYVLNEISKERHGKSLWKIIKKDSSHNMYAKARYLLRPVENIGVKDLTNELNATKVEDINKLEPGDLIKTRGICHKDGLHILIVTEVVRDDRGELFSFKYYNSNRYYGKGQGVRSGYVKIRDIKKGLKYQDWLEYDEDGKNWVYEGLMLDYDQNGIFKINDL